METTIEDLAVLLHKISHHVNVAETDDNLQDVPANLEATISQFKRLGNKAALHDIPESLWMSLTQLISTILTLCGQRGREKERSKWSSQFATFKVSYEKGKAALAEERRRVATLKTEMEGLRAEVKDERHKAAAGVAEGRNAAGEEHRAMHKEFREMHMQLLTAANDDKAKAFDQIVELKLSVSSVTKDLEEALKKVSALESELSAKDEEIQLIKSTSALKLGDVQSKLDEAKSGALAVADKETELEKTLVLLKEVQEREASAVKELEEVKEESSKLQVALEEAKESLARENRFQQYRRSPQDTNIMPNLGHSQQLHPNMGTPPSHMRTMGTPPPHMPPMQHTPPLHLQANGIQHTPAHLLANGMYHQSSPPHPSLHYGHYQSPGHAPAHFQGSPPRPVTNGGILKDTDSRPQTAHPHASQQQVPMAEFFHSPQPHGPHMTHGSPGKGHFIGQEGSPQPFQISKPSITWKSQSPPTPVMTLVSGSRSENTRPETAQSENTRPETPTKTSTKTSPTKSSAKSPTKSPTKEKETGGTLRRKFGLGRRRPPYGNEIGLTNTQVGKHGGALDHPIHVHPLVLEKWCRRRFCGVPSFADERLEQLSQGLPHALLESMWLRSWRRAVRQRRKNKRCKNEVSKETPAPLQFGKAELEPAEPVGAEIRLFGIPSKVRRPLSVLGVMVQVRMRIKAV